MQKSINLADIAKELGLSTSTISRVISGKGNISQITRDKVNQYIQRHNFRPNAIARSLATSRTNNIGVVVPTDAFLHVSPFYQICLMGICKKTVGLDYDLVLTSVTETDITYLRRMIENRKVEGVILLRSLVNDLPAQYLTNSNIPFVTVGSSANSDRYQVDVKHKDASYELTSILLDSCSDVGAIFGGLNYIVNVNRHGGAQEAFRRRGRTLDSTNCVTDAINTELIRKGTEYLATRCKTIICGDDVICVVVMNRLSELGLRIPQDIKLASLYDNEVLVNHQVPITAVKIDDNAVGSLAADAIVKLIEGKTIDKITLCDYSIALRASTAD